MKQEGVFYNNAFKAQYYYRDSFNPTVRIKTVKINNLYINTTLDIVQILQNHITL